MSITTADGIQHPLTNGRVASVQPIAPRDQIIKAGERALDELPTVSTAEIWDRWMAVGAALEAISIEAMFVGQVNSPDGSNRKYRNAHSDLIRRHRFERISKGDRSRLLECLRHRFEIEKWLDGLLIAKRLTMANPFVILRNWKKTNQPNHDRPKRVSLKSKVVELEREIAILRENDGGTLTAKDSAREVARLLKGLFSKSKLAEIRRLLGNEGAT